MYGLAEHVCADAIVLDPAKRLKLMTHWQVIYPKVLVIYTATRLDLTIAWLKDIHASLPKTRIILRMLPDNGQDSEKPAASIYARHLPVFAQIPWVTILAGNETSFDPKQPDGLDKFKAWVDNTAKLLRLAGDAGHRYAYLCSPMGNPTEDWYPHMRPAFAVAAEYERNQFHVFYTNEYRQNLQKQAGKSGLLGRYRLAWEKACAGLPRPATHIGEFNLALDSNPENGFRNLGMAESEFFSTVLIPDYRDEYAVAGVTATVFMTPPGVDPWGNLAFWDAGLEAIENGYRGQSDPVIPIDSSEETEPAYLLYKMHLDPAKQATEMNLRKIASTAGEVLAVIPNGAEVEINKNDYIQNAYTWYNARFGGQVGRLALQTGRTFAQQFTMVPDDEIIIIPDTPDNGSDPGPEKPGGETPTTGEPAPSIALMAHVALTQLRMMMIRGAAIRQQIENLDAEAQKLQADVGKLEAFLEDLSIEIPAWVQEGVAFP